MDQLKGIIFNIQRYSVHDGAGIRTNVFFKGCPLRCLWCANPESQSFKMEMSVTVKNCMGCMECINRCEQHAITQTSWDAEKCMMCRKCENICPTGAREFLGRPMTVAEVVKEVMKDWAFYQSSEGGVTLTGGEPLSQAPFAIELAKELKNNYLHLAIETSGYAPWDRVKPLFELMDEIMYDVKHMDDEQHKRLTGVSNKLILDNAAKIAKLGKPMMIRVPTIGGYNSDDENIAATARFAKEIGATEIHLLPYHRFGESKYAKLGIPYPCPDATTPSDEEMERLRQLAESFGIKAQVGG